jgi:hypothetical protein
MKRSTFTRLLTPKEQSLALDVFGTSLPMWKQIGIQDGLGLGDRPWTDNGSPHDKTLGSVNYEIMVGALASVDLTIEGSSARWLGSGFGRVCDIFVHEMTHVWQYFHGKWVKQDSLAAQAWEEITTKIDLRTGRIIVVNDAYEYTPGKAWNSYNVEQQAHIVEDWYREGHSPTHTLFPYIQMVVRASDGDLLFGHLPLDELKAYKTPRIIPLPVSTLHVTVTLPSLDGVLVPLLERRYAVNDVSGPGERERKLKEIFEGVEPEQARMLLSRLEVRRGGDKLSVVFYDHLHPATQGRLLDTLRRAVEGSMPIRFRRK